MADASDITKYLLANSPEEQDDIAKSTATRLQSKILRLREIIESLHESLFSEDAVQRAKTVQYLAAILADVDPSTLHRTDINLLVTFLVKRFENDPAGVKEATKALQQLAMMKHFDVQSATTIPEHIIRYLGDDFPSQSASTRLEVYKLLDFLLRQYRPQMQAMGGEYIRGLLTLCAREGDPRNLMICFSMIQVVLSEWDLEQVKEYIRDLWDTVSRYFPITFKPKPDDPIKITADDLKERLRACISATDLFAPFSFKFLTKKLDTQTLANVKKDVMRTISACASSYSPNIVAVEFTDIWENLKYEVISVADDELANEAIQTLSAIAHRLSFGLTADIIDESALFRYVNMIIMECSRNIFEKGQKVAKPSGRILAGIAASSPFSYQLVIRNFLPLLIAAFEKSDATILERKLLLEVLNMLLDVSVDESPSVTVVDTSILTPHQRTFRPEELEDGSLNSFTDSVGAMFASALNGASPEEVSYRITALQGLRKMTMRPGLLSTSEVGLYINYFTQCILDSRKADDPLRDEAIEALQDCAAVHSRHILDSTFPALLGTLPDTLVNDTDGRDHLPILEALGKISSKGDLFNTFSRRLLNKVSTVVRNNDSFDYVHVILAGLLYGIQQRENARKMESDRLDSTIQHQRQRDLEQYQIIVKTLYREITSLSQEDSRISAVVRIQPIQTLSESKTPDDMLIDLIGKIAMTAIRSMDVHEQDWAVSEIFSLFAQVNETISDAPLALTQQALHTNGFGHEIAISGTQLDLERATDNQKRAFTLSMYLLAGLRREVCGPYIYNAYDQFLISLQSIMNFDIREVCSQVINYIEVSPHLAPSIQFSLIHLVALLANKWNATTDSNQPRASQAPPPQDLIEQLIHSLVDKSVSSAVGILELATVFTKAVNFKGDRCVSGLLDVFLGGLSDKIRGTEFAAHFRHLLSPSDILCKENFAIIRPLHKHRLFSKCVPTIVKDFRASSDQSIKSNYLVALSGILKYMPSDIVIPEIEILLPLLLQSLETPGNNVKAASIDVLNVAIVESAAAVEGHIQSIIKRLIGTFHNTAEEPSDSSPAVRAKALVCMAAIPKHLRLTIVLPYKRLVLQRLGIAVNDVKRKVRTEAVDCQMAWWNLAEPTDEDD